MGNLNPLGWDGTEYTEQEKRAQLAPFLPLTLSKPELIGLPFGIQVQSTGSAMNSGISGHIIMQTHYVSSRYPCELTFDQHILTPFGGPSGKFNLIERDSNDWDYFDISGNFLSGGYSKVTIATATGGFTNAITMNATVTSGANGSRHSRVIKVNTVDKVYLIDYFPGTSGNGIYSIKARELTPIMNASFGQATLLARSTSVNETLEG